MTVVSHQKDSGMVHELVVSWLVYKPIDNSQLPSKLRHRSIFLTVQNNQRHICYVQDLPNLQQFFQIEDE